MHFTGGVNHPIDQKVIAKKKGLPNMSFLGGCFFSTSPEREAVKMMVILFSTCFSAMCQGDKSN